MGSRYPCILSFSTSISKLIFNLRFTKWLWSEKQEDENIFRSRQRNASVLESRASFSVHGGDTCIWWRLRQHNLQKWIYLLCLSLDSPRKTSSTVHYRLHCLFTVWIIIIDSLFFLWTSSSLLNSFFFNLLVHVVFN